MTDRQRLAVWICWKDIRHPEAGGAELVHHELSKRLVADGWEVVHLVPGFAGCLPEEVVDGIRVVRVGTSILSFYRLPMVFRRRFRAQTDMLVDAFISLGSFACLMMPAERAAIMIHHIEDIKWFYQNSFAGVPRWLMPFFQVAGYFIEKAQLVCLAWLFRGRVITVSRSTADELVRHGFRRERIRIIRETISTTALPSLAAAKPKEPGFTVLAVGMRKVKRPDHVMKAFELFQTDHPDACLWMAGWGGMSDTLKRRVSRRSIRNVTFWSRVTDAQRDDLLQRAHVLCAASIREGWGLVVVEANAMGTPVIGYDVPGLRDALAFDNGWLCQPHPAAMAQRLQEAYDTWRDAERYKCLCERCLEAGRQFTPERSYEDFKAALVDTIEPREDQGS